MYLNCRTFYLLKFVFTSNRCYFWSLR